MRFILGALLLLMVVGFFAGAGKTPPSSDTSSAETTPVVSIAPYGERLASSMDVLSGFEVASYTGSVEMIGLAIGLFDVWAGLLDEGHGMSMSDETARQRDLFAAALRKTQKVALPALRDKYGPALRKLLWEDDISARTVGAGFRTIDLVGGLFAANRNIKKVNETIYPVLMRLRFTRSQYRWFEGASEYTYYNLTPPADDVVAVFSDGGTFREIDL